MVLALLSITFLGTGGFLVIRYKLMYMWYNYIIDKAAIIMTNSGTVTNLGGQPSTGYTNLDKS